MDIAKVLEFLQAFRAGDWWAAGEVGGLLFSQFCHVMRGPHDDTVRSALEAGMSAALLSDTELAAQIEAQARSVQATPAGINPLLVVLITEAIRRVTEELLKRLSR
jgi:hypothetical protein